jgi:hypothetical protein
MTQTLYAHMNKKIKKKTTSTKKKKGEWWREWIQVWYIWYILRTFLNATMYTHPEKQ